MTREPLRDIVSRQLVHLGQHGRPLHPNSGRSTLDLYADDRRRDRTLHEVIEWYLDLAEPDRDGRCAAIISAGPPGAGKSTALRERHLVDTSSRYLDADIVKDELLRRAIADGHYADLLSTTLADTHPIAPRELAALVHAESTEVIDDVREVRLQRRENVVIEGALQWGPLGDILMAQLSEHDYTDVHIVDIEVPASIAQEQAVRRWWEGRLRGISGHDRMGGRITPPVAIARLYEEGPVSRCATHARAAFESSLAAAITQVTSTADSAPSRWFRGASRASWSKERNPPPAKGPSVRLDAERRAREKICGGHRRTVVGSRRLIRWVCSDGRLASAIGHRGGRVAADWASGSASTTGGILGEPARATAAWGLMRMGVR
ncbi:zeta toxin family protein [Rhodococcus sp. USK13]|nr:zeta toxin family protein [Rhodococcus sp. USK13]